MMMRWTRSIAGTASGAFAGLLAATYCGAVGMSIFVLSEAVATPLMVFSCWMLWRSTQRNPDRDGSQFWTSRRWLATAYSAIALGLACLARPSWGLWPGLALPLVAFASKRCGLYFWRNWDPSQKPYTKNAGQKPYTLKNIFKSILFRLF
jgi:hypothetical protein